MMIPFLSIATVGRSLLCFVRADSGVTFSEDIVSPLVDMFKSRAKVCRVKENC